MKHSYKIKNFLAVQSKLLVHFVHYTASTIYNHGANWQFYNKHTNSTNYKNSEMFIAPCVAPDAI